MRIAVVGSGIAGLGAAWALSRAHEVTVYEAADAPGGHAATVEVEEPAGPVPVDTGFIVYNERNYPNLIRLFRHLGVETEPSDMSFSVSRDGGRFEYQARALGLLAQPGNLLRPGYRRMIRDILRFSREAATAVAGDDETTGELLDRLGLTHAFRRDFLLPMIACIWSSSLERMLTYPARSMVRFLDNHGLLDVLERPRWRTVTGGSREYVRRVVAGMSAELRPTTPVASVARLPQAVVVRDAAGRAETFDHLVLATHADTSLDILGPDASPEEREVLSAFRYQENRAVLHRDPALMPARRRVWSSWNYLDHGTGDGTERISLSYWMNRLQNLETERPLIVTLNPAREPDSIESEHTYHHPQYDHSAVRAQGRIRSIEGTQRTWFCGSYRGDGFHEDGLRSGLEVAARLGSPAPWWDGSSGPVPSRPEAIGSPI